MRSRLENWLLSRWYGDRRPHMGLRFLERLYRAAFNYRKSKARPDGNPYQHRKPLVIVGNITAGGTGKTPLVMRLAQLAVEAGLKPGIVSTGYGRRGKQLVKVKADSDPLDCGDEPVLMAQRTKLPVIVARKREDGIRALEEMGVDIVISDDGLQQAALKANIEICVVDGSRGVGNGFLIPAGPLREPAERLQEVDYVVSNGHWDQRPGGLAVKPMALVADTVCSLDDSETLQFDQFCERYAESRIMAVAGIGNPARFFAMLQAHGIASQNHAFPDHHLFSAADFTSLGDADIILMTEKDAVKCRRLGLGNAWYIPVNCSLEEPFEQQLMSQMRKLAGDSR